MNSTLSNFVIFAAGAAIGSAVSWRFLKARYERIAQEEIDSVKEVFSKIHNKNTDDIEQGESMVKESVDIYENVIYENAYNAESTKGGDPVVNGDGPYVITPEEFDTRDDYETISLTYYADGVLADELDYRVEDVDNTVGTESLSHFGEYEDDAVFVRNDQLKADYEILFDTRKYEDVVRSTGPRHVEE